MELRPKIRLAALILKGENEVLLGKTRIDPERGNWIFPGSELEFGDTYHRGIFNNLWKNIGLRQTDILLMDEYPKITTNDIYENGNDHYVTLFIRGKYIKRRPGIKDKEKYETLDWFKWDNLPEPLSLPIRNLLKQDYNPFF